MVRDRLQVRVLGATVFKLLGTSFALFLIINIVVTYAFGVRGAIALLRTPTYVASLLAVIVALIASALATRLAKTINARVGRVTGIEIGLDEVLGFEFFFSCIPTVIATYAFYVFPNLITILLCSTFVFAALVTNACVLFVVLWMYIHVEAIVRTAEELLRSVEVTQK